MAKSGREQGNENAMKLHKYLCSIDVIPSRGGKANITAIADACGFDRQILYKNSQARKLLEQAIAQKGLSGIQTFDESVDLERVALERQVTSLQQKNSSLIAEVYELRAKLKRYKHIEEILQTGKRVIP